MTGLTVTPKRRQLALVVMAVCILAAATLYAHHEWSERQHGLTVDRARTAAAEAASESVPVMLSYQTTSLERDLERSQAVITDRFRDEFTRLQDKLIKPAVDERGFQTTAVVERLGLIEAAKKEVSLLVFITQNTTSAQQPDGEPVATRATVRMRLEDGHWLVDDLRPV